MVSLLEPTLPCSVIRLDQREEPLAPGDLRLRVRDLAVVLLDALSAVVAHEAVTAVDAADDEKLGPGVGRRTKVGLHLGPTGRDG